MANTLLLRLEGPLQSWGERAHWSIRDTASEPTKSGVVGLLGCMLGLSTDEDLRALSHSIRIGVRCDQPGVLLRDYHTVVGGVMSAEGKIKVNANTREPETVVSERTYLADASFLVAVESDPQTIARLVDAMQNPVWPIFLGRKSCPPAMPVFVDIGDYDSLEVALVSKPVAVRSRTEEKDVRLRAVLECSPEDESAVRRRDEIDSHSRRTFHPRYAREVLLTVPVQEVP